MRLPRPRVVALQRCLRRLRQMYLSARSPWPRRIFWRWLKNVTKRSFRRIKWPPTSKLGDSKPWIMWGGRFFLLGWLALSFGGWILFFFFGWWFVELLFFLGGGATFLEDLFCGTRRSKSTSKTHLIWYVAGIYYWKLRKKIVICFTGSFVCCCLGQLNFAYQAAAGPRVLKSSFSLMRFFAGEDFIPNSQQIVSGVEVWIVQLYVCIINESPYLGIREIPPPTLPVTVGFPWEMKWLKLGDVRGDLPPQARMHFFTTRIPHDCNL